MDGADPRESGNRERGGVLAPGSRGWGGEGEPNKFQEVWGAGSRETGRKVTEVSKVLVEVTEGGKGMPREGDELVPRRLLAAAIRILLSTVVQRGSFLIHVI